MPRRGELYLASDAPGDAKSNRVVLVVSRQRFLDSNHPMVVCVPVYSRGQGLTTQVQIGVAEGLKHDSSLHCDDIIRMRREQLRAWVGTLSRAKMREVNTALTIALGLDDNEG